MKKRRAAKIAHSVTQWHLQQGLEAKQANDTFAAGFHRVWLLKAPKLSERPSGR